MTSVEPTKAAEAALPPITLAVRTPGQAAMRHLLDELDRRMLGDAIPPDLMSWHVGALGEVLVGHELARLPAEWTVLHAVPVGDQADIDHLVIGPPGVFVLNTKRHQNKRVAVGTHVVWINGSQEVGHVKHLAGRAHKVAAALESEATGPIPVHPLLVFVDALSVRLVGEQTVGAVAAAGLVDHLLGMTSAMSSEALRATVELAGRPTTWGAPASVLYEPDPTLRFLSLKVSPTTAESTRRPAVRRPQATRRSPMRRATSVDEMNRRILRVIGGIALVLISPFLLLIGLGALLQLLAALSR